MKIIGLSAGRERSAALAEDGTAWCWGGIKRLGATLPPGYPADLCTTNATEIGHNRYAQPIPQALNPAAPFTAIADGYVDTLGVKRSGAVLSCRPVVAPDRGAIRSLVAVTYLERLDRIGKPEPIGVAPGEAIRPIELLDLQIGNMGGIAACLNLRLEQRAGRLPEAKALILLDREADIFLARRAEADGWLIKPFDSFRLRRAVQTVLSTGSYTEGVPDEWQHIAPLLNH